MPHDVIRRIPRPVQALLLAALLVLTALERPAAPACPGAGPGADALVQAALARLTASPQDTAGAAACFEAAYAAGDPGAAAARGQLALAGPPGAADPTLAAHWFFLAAQAGSPQGYLDAGLALARGQGVPVDPYWAYWHLGRGLALPGLSPEEANLAREASEAAAKKLTPAERATLDANLSGKAAP